MVFNAHYLAYCDHAMDEFLRAVAPPRTDVELMLKAAHLVACAVAVPRSRGDGVQRGAVGTTSMDVHFLGRVGEQVRFEATITYVAVADPQGRALPIPIDDQTRAAFDAPG